MAKTEGITANAPKLVNIFGELSDVTTIARANGKILKLATIYSPSGKKINVGISGTVGISKLAELPLDTMVDIEAEECIKGQTTYEEDDVVKVHDFDGLFAKVIHRASAREFRTKFADHLESKYASRLNALEPEQRTAEIDYLAKLNGL